MNENLENTKYMCFSFIIGILYQKESNFLSMNWGHYLLIILLILDRHVLRLKFLINLEILKTDRFRIIIKRFKNKAKSIKNHPIKNKNFKENEIKIDEENFKVKFKSIEENLLDDTSKVIIEEKFKISNRVNQRHLTITKEHQYYDEMEFKLNIQSCKILRRFIRIFYNLTYYPIKTETKSSNIYNDLQHLIKILLGELIVIMIFVCAIVKMNLFSIFFLIILLVLQLKGKNVQNFYGSFVFIFFLVFIQYSFFILNINENSGPTLKPSQLLQSKLNEYSIPLFNNLGIQNFSQLYYLSAGVSNYQIKSLWVDFFTMVICIIWLENYSFPKFDSRYDSKFNINVIHEKESVSAAIQKIDISEYNDLKETLEYNFGIKLPELNELKKRRQSKFSQKFTKDDENKLNNQIVISPMKALERKSYITNLENFIKIENKNKLFRFFNLTKKTIYLTMTNFMLFFILIISIFNNCLISIIYISFALYYIYKSRDLYLAHKWNLPKALHYFLRPLIFLNIFLLIIYQNPLTESIKKFDKIIYILKLLGIHSLITYESFNESKIMEFYSSKIFMLILKIFSYILVSLQITIHSSNDFKNFYITFLFKKKQSIYKNSMINTFLFNNLRIKRMDYSMHFRNKISETLKNLEKQLEKWNENLNIDLNKRMERNHLKIDSNLSFRNLKRKFRKKSTLSKNVDYYNKKSKIYIILIYL